MGCAFSSRRRAPRRDRRVQLRHGDLEDSILPENWKANDVLFQYIESVRKTLENNLPGSMLMTIAVYYPCKNSRCKFKAGTFMGDEFNTVEWTDSKCIRSGCKHPLSRHIRHINYVSNTEYMAVIKLVFDINNIKASLKMSYAKPKSQRNILIEGVYELVYKVLCKSIRYDLFKAPNIDTIYGSPPFEQISIRQILINFSMLFCRNNEFLTFKQALMVTKFLLHSFDSWMWIVPDKKPNFDTDLFTNSYSYYFCRYMVYCEMPRLAHSISPRYKASMIFGCDVLRYTLESFYKELQVWCSKSNIMWNQHTKLHCLKYLPIYMTILKTEYEYCGSSIWNIPTALSDVTGRDELYMLYELFELYENP